MSFHFRCAIAAVLVSLALGACSPQAALLSYLIPEGTFSTLLGNLEKVTDDNRRRIVELERAGRWDELARLADQNLAKDASNAEWWLVSGYARSQLGEHRAAVKAYGEAVRLEPDSAAGWNLLAQSHRAAGDSQRAVVVLNNALLALRDAPVTVYLLGESYSDLGRFDSALTAYQQALAIEADFPAAWFGLARAYGKLGRPGEAREARARLEKLDPAMAKRLADIGEVKGTAARD
jgi:tetratricopeptide (TPR) repeat protein